ncbi:cytochrome c-type biogenesis protein [Halogeometricum rufum]|uniref:Cytochrome c-type biogenesis protein n=1 Tax=Halogeometricum rufum TaxID=553469 RepID=A0A1I6IRD8_9EURY|nr:cytochrome c biogenesis protein CcdA [Halogeometricum rufum]SFR69189.1 cytochrome c-type biogenesis protein [Halogeometricum rufum]
MAGLALPALFALSFSAGVATFFAPCAFPLLPGYLSYFLSDTVTRADGRGVAEAAASTGGSTGTSALVTRVRRPLARAVLMSLLAGVGMTAVYVGLAGSAAFLGAQALADVAILELVVGAVFVLAGGLMAAGWKPSRSVVRLPERERSLGGFFLFGVLYAGAAAGCTAPLFIAVVLQGMSLGPVLGVGVAVAYAVGMSSVLMVVTSATALGGSSLTTVLSAHTRTIYRAAGVLLAVSGVAEMYYYFYGFPEVFPQ